MFGKQGSRGRLSEIGAGIFQAMPTPTICQKIGSPHRLRRKRGMCCISPSCLAQSQGVEVSLEQKETSKANEPPPMKILTVTVV